MSIIFEGNPSNWIKQRRQELGITRKELSFKIKLSISMINSIETGRRKIHEDRIYLLAEALEIPECEINSFKNFVLLHKNQEANQHQNTTMCSHIYEKEEALEDETCNKLEFDQKIPQEINSTKQINQTQLHQSEPNEDTNKLNRKASFKEAKTLPYRNSPYYLMPLLAFAVIIMYLLFNYADFTKQETDSNFYTSDQKYYARICDTVMLPRGFFWHQGNNIDSGCHILKNSIVITAGPRTIQSLDGRQDRTAPLLTKEVSGNFVVQVKLHYDGGPDCCRHAGLGVRDTGNDFLWIRITKDSRDYVINSEGRIYDLVKHSRKKSEHLAKSYGNQPIYLQIERHNSTLTTRYSYDGNSWKDDEFFNEFPFSDNLEVFLMVEAAYDPPKSSAEFTDFHIIPQP